MLAWQASVFWSSLKKVAHDAASRHPPDVLTVEHDHAATWERDIARDVPRLLTLQNVGWIYYERRAQAAAGFRAAMFRGEGRRFRRYATKTLARYDLLASVSDNDRDVLKAATGKPIEVIPNGVATSTFAPQPHRCEQPSLVFTATLSHPPNSEGIVWFVRQVWPQLVATRPETSLVIVGRDPPPAVVALASDPRITVTGAVPDIAPFFRDAAVAIVPLLSGGGTRLKVLEAFAFARATVSTPMGAEGLRVESGTHLELAEDAESFAAATVALLDDPARRKALAAAGRDLAEREYDWDSIGDRYDVLLRSLANHGGRAPLRDP